MVEATQCTASLKAAVTHLCDSKAKSKFIKKKSKSDSLKSLGCLLACGAQRSHPKMWGSMEPTVLPEVEVFTGEGPVLRAGCGLHQRITSFALCAVPQIGLFDLEVNCLTKILFGALVVVSLVMVALQHFAGRWYLQIIRFLLLFSNIIPIR